MKKQRKHYSPGEKVAILRRHLLDKEPISKLCDELGLQPTVKPFRRDHVPPPQWLDQDTQTRTPGSLCSLRFATLVLRLNQDVLL